MYDVSSELSLPCARLGADVAPGDAGATASAAPGEGNSSRGGAALAAPWRIAQPGLTAQWHWPVWALCTVRRALCCQGLWCTGSVRCAVLCIRETGDSATQAMHELGCTSLNGNQTR